MLLLQAGGIFTATDLEIGSLSLLLTVRLVAYCSTTGTSYPFQFWSWSDTIQTDVVRIPCSAGGSTKIYRTLSTYRYGGGGDVKTHTFGDDGELFWGKKVFSSVPYWRPERVGFPPLEATNYFVRKRTHVSQISSRVPIPREQTYPPERLVCKWKAP